jgi:glycosyltransferase involved in cell wall biosynthesis
VISIAMATYNGEKFLEQQLQSLATQTLLPAELIVCDDTSTDATPEIVKRFSETAPFPVTLVVNEQRLGWRGNFLKAASLCRSEYIAFCDQDDIWLPEKLAVVQSHLEKERPTLLQHGYRMIDSAGNIISEPLTYEHLEPSDPWVHSYGLNQVFDRSLVEFFDLWEVSKDHFHTNERMAHDQLVFFLSSLLGKTLTIKDVLLHYRQHGTNAVGFVAARDYGGFARSFLRTLRNVGDRGEGQGKRKFLLGVLRQRFAGATARKIMTERIMSRLPKDRAQQLSPKLKYYQDCSLYLSARLRAYEPRSFGQRAAGIVSALGKGRYREAGRTGARDLGVDLLYGVLGSRSPGALDS